MKKQWKPLLPPFRIYKKKVFSQNIKTAGLVYQIGESKFLRRPSLQVPLSVIKTKKFQDQLRRAKKTLLKYRELTKKGRGIAAVQVGIPLRFSVVYLKKEHKLWVLINPEILERSIKLLEYSEMCMSAAPLIAPVVRPAWVVVSYYDENGRHKIWDKKDTNAENRMLNRVIQHEIDHMDGIINIDRVESKKLIFESDPSFYDKAKFKKIRELGKKSGNTRELEAKISRR